MPYVILPCAFVMRQLSNILCIKQHAPTLASCNFWQSWTNFDNFQQSTWEYFQKK